MDELIDIDALRKSVSEVLARECGREAVLHHTGQSNGPILPLWQTATELGWMALLISEEHGGIGLGFDALAPVYEELGRVVAPLPFLTTLLAADAIQRSGSAEQKSEWLPQLASGQMATLSAPLYVAATSLNIEFDGDDIVLSGTAKHLVDARDAKLILLLSVDEEGSHHRVVITKEDHLAMETTKMWDHGHTLSSLTLDKVRLPATRAFGVTVDSEDALLSHAALGLAAEAVGGSEGILAITIEYLKTREQFGKPIGSFQAIKHRVANHQTNIVAARALLRSAVKMAAAGEPDAAAEASAAKALACAYYAEVARDSVQLHGGMGFTAEQVCHLYVKRAHFIAHLFGNETLHNSRAVDAIFNAEAA